MASSDFWKVGNLRPGSAREGIRLWWHCRGRGEDRVGPLGSRFGFINTTSTRSPYRDFYPSLGLLVFTTFCSALSTGHSFRAPSLHRSNFESSLSSQPELSNAGIGAHFHLGKAFLSLTDVQHGPQHYAHKPPGPWLREGGFVDGGRQGGRSRRMRRRTTTTCTDWQTATTTDEQCSCAFIYFSR